jgi:hypothetical protein
MALSEPLGTGLFVGNVVLGLTVMMAQSVHQVSWLILRQGMQGTQQARGRGGVGMVVRVRIMMGPRVGRLLHRSHLVALCSDHQQTLQVPTVACVLLHVVLSGCQATCFPPCVLLSWGRCYSLHGAIECALPVCLPCAVLGCMCWTCCMYVVFSRAAMPLHIAFNHWQVVLDRRNFLKDVLFYLGAVSMVLAWWVAGLVGGSVQLDSQGSAPRCAETAKDRPAHMPGGACGVKQHYRPGLHLLPCFRNLWDTPLTDAL